MRPQTQRRRLGFSLRDRLLILNLGTGLLLVLLSLLVVDIFARRQVRQQVADDLVTTGSVFTKFMEERAQWLRAQTLVVAEDPRFSATLDLVDPNLSDPDLAEPDLDSHARTVTQEAKRFQAILGSDLFVATGRQGVVLTQLELDRPPRIDARSRQEDGSIWWTVDDSRFRIHRSLVKEALVNGGEAVIGVLAVGYLTSTGDEQRLQSLLDEMAADSATAQRLREGRDSEVMWDLQIAFIADLVAVLDAAAEVRKLLTCHVSFGDDLSRQPAVAAALRGEQGVELRAQGRRLFHTVIVPVWSPDGLVGTLSTGSRIDDELAADLRAMTRSHVTFFGFDRMLVASTWEAAARRDLHAPLDVGSGPMEMEVAGETFLSLAGRFGDTSSDGGAIFLIQRSLDEAYEFIYTLEELLLLVAAVVFILAAIASFVGARRLSRPVEALVVGTRALATGDLDHRIAVESRSELGELAASFNDMAAALKRSRQALEESEGAYRDLFDNAQDLVYTTDLDRRLTSVNEASLQSLGYTPEELRGRDLYELVAEDQRRAFAERDRHAPEGVERPVMEAVFLRRDGRRETFELVSRWVVLDGRVVGLQAIGRNITQRREREQATARFREQLSEAEKLRALGEMAAGVAHNFNNLLTVVVGNAELIALRDDIPEPIRDETKWILDSAHRCAAIVRRIQTFGRPIDLKARDAIDMSRLIRDVVDITRPKWKTEPELAGHSVVLETDLAHDLPSIHSQGSAWEEILSNLIFNAVDAMPEGGTIRLAMRQDGDHVTLSVTDTGTGMDEETKRRIFEPFFTTKEEEKGTGLGLSTVWGLIQHLGCRIDVDSALGEGTTFTLRIPVAGEAAEDDAVPVPVNDDQEALHILVVDDEPQVLELLPSLLEGHHVIIALGGSEGLDLVMQRAWDIVITDWVMAGVSGLELAQAARDLHPHTVVMLMSGWEFKADDVEGAAAVDLVLEKPFRRQDVSERVREAEMLVRQRRQNASGGVPAERVE